MRSLYEDLPPVEIAGRKLVGRVLFGLLVLVSALVGATAGLLLVYTTDLPQVEALDAYRPSLITELYDHHRRVIGSFAPHRRTPARPRASRFFLGTGWMDSRRHRSSTSASPPKILLWPRLHCWRVCLRVRGFTHRSIIPTAR